MRIAVDARWIFPEVSGVGTYTIELLHALCALDRRNEYRLLFSDAQVRDRTFSTTHLQKSDNFQPLMIPYGLFSLRNQLALPSLLKRESIDLFHSTNYMIPFRAFPKNHRGSIPCITTIHDVIPMVFPDHAPKSRKSRLFPLYRRLMMEIGARSDAILTVSKASKADIQQHLKIPESTASKIAVVYNGVSPLFTPGENHKKSGTGASDNGKTILYVGRQDPYKNLTGLMQVFARVQQKADFPVTLIVAGAPDPRYPEAAQLAQQLGIDRDVTWTGYLSATELVHLYQDADILAHPSRYEGFGLQILEAMACGLPVVSSNRASLPEVAGKAAILVDPDDEKAFSDKILQLLTNKDLYADLAQKGPAQAAQFSWTRTAEATLAVYEQLKNTRKKNS